MDNKRWTLKARNSLLFWESECEEGRAQSMEAQGALKTFKRLLADNGYEFCSHNAAILGSKRYAKYKLPNMDYMLTCKQYKEYRENSHGEE